MEEFAHSLAFFVAIDDYTNGIPKLSTPVADAEEIAKVLREKHDFTTEILKNEAATLANLRSFLESLKERVGPSDRVVFYFAGHGIGMGSDTGPVGYLLPQDAERDSSSGYLPMQDLAAALGKLSCRHLLLILDCCFAGLLRTRHLVPAPEQLHDQRYKWFVEFPAWQAIASAAHDERALDVAAERALGKRDESQAHSPFAQALIDGLSGSADRPPKGASEGDGVITVTELYLHLREALLPADKWSFRQTPMFWSLDNRRKGEFVFLAPGVELDLPPAPKLDETSNPWRGLKPYDSSDKDLFFGRRRASEQLLDQVLRDPLVVVTGPSGAGKSSLVRAGLLHRLPGSSLHVVVKPGPAPFASLATSLRGVSASSPDAATLEANPSALANWVKNQQLVGREILLVIDQAEELVTQARGSHAARRFLELIEIALNQASLAPSPKIAFTEAEAREMLSSLGYSDVGELHLKADGTWHASATLEGKPVQAVLDIAKRPLRVVFTIRSEFEPQFAQLPLKDRWRSSRYFIPQMTQDELRRVIEEPATARVMRFEPPDLVDSLVNEVVQMPGALPLLSFALSEMYLSYLKSPSPMHDRTLTRQHYDALQGGVAGSLRIRATNLIGSLDDDQQLTARRVLERLVSIESGEFARRRVPRRELDTADPAERKRVKRVLDKLDEAVLIVTDDVENEPHIEFAHDALILGWDLLVGWLREDLTRIVALRRLTPDAEQWGVSKDAGLLWDDAARVGVIREMQSSQSPGLNATEAKFAGASLQRSRRNKIAWWSVAAVLFVLAVGASITAWIATEARIEAREQADRAERTLAAATATASGLVFDLAVEFRDIVGMPAATIKNILDRARKLQEQLLPGNESNVELRRSQAAALMETSVTLLTLGDTLGALTAAQDAQAILAKLLQRQPERSDIKGALGVSHNRVGNAQFARGKLAEALAAYQAGFAIAKGLAASDRSNDHWQRDLSVSYDNVGNVQFAQGKLAEALASYQVGLTIAETLAESGPGNPGWQSDLATSYSKVGNVQVAQGKLAEALASYEATLAIMKQLAASHDGNTLWKRGVSVSYQKVGDVQVAQGKLAEASASYEASVKIIKPLADSDPDKAGWQRDLTVSYNKVGNLQVAQGKLEEALITYQASLDIRKQLVLRYPGNAGPERDSSVSYDNVGDVLAQLEKLDEALASYETSLDIRKKLAEREPDNAGWQRDLSVSYVNVGDIRVDLGQYVEALESYNAGFDIRKPLAERDSSNTGAQRDLSVSYNNIGDVKLPQDELAEALASYEESLSIRKRLAEFDSGNTVWQHDLSVSYENVGNVQVAQGSATEALASYQASKVILERLAASDLENAGWQHDVAMSYSSLASAYRKMGQYAEARDALIKGRWIILQLLKVNPQHPQWKDNLVAFDKQIADLPN